MAMGFSTPTGSLKSSSSPSFWFSSPSHPCRFSAWTRVTSSSSFPKMSPRWDHYYLWTMSGPSSSTTNFSSSNKLLRNPSYSIRTYTTKDTMCKIDKTVHQYRSEHRLKYVLRSSSTSSAPTLLQESDTTCFEENLVAEPGDYVLASSSTSSAPTLLQESGTTCFEENLVAVPGDYLNGSVNQHEYCGNFNDEDNECTNIQNSKAKSTKVVPHGTENCSDKLAYDISKITGSNRSQDGSVYITKSFSGPSSISEIGNDNEQRQRFRQSRPRSSSNGGVFSETHKGTRTTPCLTDVNDVSDVNSNRKLKHGPTDEPSSRERINTILLNGSSREFLQTPEQFSSDKVKSKPEPKTKQIDLCKNLSSVYKNVLVINNISSAKKIVRLLTTKYRDVVHACDTEVAKIDLKQQTPVDHGEIICFSIYSGPEADFGNGKSCIWVDVLDGGGRKLLREFAPFFEDSSIKKVWHNYSFDSHVIENYGIKIAGFHADTMHMARLWDSSRRTEGGYSLEALTSNSKVMNGARSLINKELIGKVSMKTIFGKKKLKKDGNEGKITIVAPVEELQREEQNLWICYSALDSMSTLQLYESLKCKLQNMVWSFNGVKKENATMYNFYEEYWRPFGELLVKMESEGMLVDREYLAEVEKVATQEKQIAENRFRKWAAGRCPDAIHMNVGSDAQLRQLFFGGIMNRMDQNAMLPVTRTFKVPNVDKVIEEGKKVPSKQRNIKLSRLSDQIIETEMYTPSGWPSVCGDALKVLAGKVSSQYDLVDPLLSTDVEDSTSQKRKEDVDISLYGTAYKAFGGDETGKEACHAIAALCEVCSIDSLISNFILPLQSNHISGKNGRIHCSLNINTETGRLSARRPNLQNQPALEKDRYKIRQAFIAAPGSSLIVADYGQLELRILAHLTNCTSMKNAFKAGGDFHSRTAMNMYSHIREAVENKEVLLEWYPQAGEDRPSVPLLKDAFASERRKAKMLNFSIAYGKTPIGLARDWKVSMKEARETVDLWYKDRKEVRQWQEEQKKEANTRRCVKTLLGRTRSFPSMKGASNAHKGHIERAAINTPVQGSAADVAMCAMLEISRNAQLKELGWRLLLQVHDEVILEGPTESAEVAKAIVIECMSKPFGGKNILTVDLAVDAKCAQNWYAAK